MFYCQRKLWILQTGFATVPLLLNLRLGNLFEVSNYFGNCGNIWKDIINNPWNTCILLPSLDHLFTKFFSFSHFRSSPLFAFITIFWRLLRHLMKSSPKVTGVTMINSFVLSDQNAVFLFKLLAMRPPTSSLCQTACLLWIP